MTKSNFFAMLFVFAVIGIFVGILISAYSSTNFEGQNNYEFMPNDIVQNRTMTLDFIETEPNDSVTQINLNENIDINTQQPEENISNSENINNNSQKNIVPENVKAIYLTRMGCRN